MDPLGTLLGSCLGRAPGLPGIQLENILSPVITAPGYMAPSSINLFPVLGNTPADTSCEQD